MNDQSLLPFAAYTESIWHLSQYLEKEKIQFLLVHEWLSANKRSWEEKTSFTSTVLLISLNKSDNVTPRGLFLGNRRKTIANCGRKQLPNWPLRTYSESPPASSVTWTWTGACHIKVSSLFYPHERWSCYRRRTKETCVFSFTTLTPPPFLLDLTRSLTVSLFQERKKERI